MKLKTLIVYYSEHHGNTKKVARAMAEVLNAELLKTQDIDLGIISQHDLIGFGSGIYWGRHHKQLFDIIDKLPNQISKKAFIFSTSGAVNKSMSFHEHLKSKLSKKGFEIIGEFSCLGFDTAISESGINKGKPNDKDLNKAKEFALNLLSK